MSMQVKNIDQRTENKEKLWLITHGSVANDIANVFFLNQVLNTTL